MELFLQKVLFMALCMGGSAYLLGNDKGLLCLEYWEYWRCRGILEHSLNSHAESPGSNLTIAAALCPSARQFIHIAALDPGVLMGTR